MLKRLAVLFVLMSPLASPAAAETFAAHCIRVVDGDTIAVVRGNETLIVRLLAVDAPEMEQPHGIEAKQFLASLVADKTVTIDEHGKDLYGRILGSVLVGGLDTSAELVRAGWAWHYILDARVPFLVSLEGEARAGASRPLGRPRSRGALGVAEEASLAVRPRAGRPPQGARDPRAPAGDRIAEGCGS